jgi:hypothetical protein
MFLSRFINPKLKCKSRLLRKGIKAKFSNLQDEELKLKNHLKFLGYNKKDEYEIDLENAKSIYANIIKILQKQLNTDDMEKINMKMRQVIIKFQYLEESFIKKEIKKSEAKRIINHLKFTNKQWINRYLDNKRINRNILNQINNLNLLLIDIDYFDEYLRRTDSSQDLFEEKHIQSNDEIMDELRKPLRESMFKYKFNKYKKSLGHKADIQESLLKKNESKQLENIFYKNLNSDQLISENYLHELGKEKKQFTREEIILNLGADQEFIKNKEKYKQFTFSFLNNIKGTFDESNGLNEEYGKVENENSFHYDNAHDYTKYENIQIESITPQNQLINKAEQFGDKINELSFIETPKPIYIQYNLLNEGTINNFKETYQSFESINNSSMITSNNFSSKYRENFKNLEKMNDFVYLNMGESKEFVSNWLYLYNLPYDFNRKEMEEDLISNLEKFGEIERVHLLRSSDIIQIKTNKKTENLKNSFTSFNTIKDDLDSKFLSKDDLDLDMLGKFGVYNPNEKTFNIDQNKNFYQDLNNKMFQKELGSKQKSGAFIKFRSYDSKKNLLKSNLVLFGVALTKNHLLFLEDADFKTTLNISNFSLFTSLSKLVTFLNYHFRENGMIEVPLNEDVKNTIISNSSLYIKFPSLEEAMRASLLINHLEFDGNVLCSDFAYGKLKDIQGQKYEKILKIDQFEVFENIKDQNSKTRIELEQKNDIDFLQRGLMSQQQRSEIDHEEDIESIYESLKNQYKFLDNLDTNFENDEDDEFEFKNFIQFEHLF